jgi:hypothetical protein
MNVNPDGHMPGWQGLTIKEILEKVDLFNIATLDEEEKKATVDTRDVKVKLGGCAKACLLRITLRQNEG